MTKQVLFIQGGGEGTHDDWDNKLVESLERELGRDFADDGTFQHWRFLGMAAR